MSIIWPNPHAILAAGGRYRCVRCFTNYDVSLGRDGELRCGACHRGQARCLYCFVTLKGRLTTGTGLYCSGLCEELGKLRDRALERSARRHNFDVMNRRKASFQ